MIPCAPIAKGTLSLSYLKDTVDVQHILRTGFHFQLVMTNSLNNQLPVVNWWNTASDQVPFRPDIALLLSLLNFFLLKKLCVGLSSRPLAC